jgi:nucleotide-binding universal stress UspA family protein
MATHSRRGLRRALFGSTTEAVIKSGIAPVLVVHPKD